MSGAREPWKIIYAGTAVTLAIAGAIFVWNVWDTGHTTGAHVVPRSAAAFNADIAAERYRVLSRVQPPAYVSAPNAAPDFTNAMNAYAQRDYEAAIAGLSAVVYSKPAFVPAHFYLGVCDLIMRDRLSAIAQFKAVIAAGETPYLEQARFYLAKALLAGFDAGAARSELKRVVGMGGPLADEAQKILNQI